MLGGKNSERGLVVPKNRFLWHEQVVKDLNTAPDSKWTWTMERPVIQEASSQVESYDEPLFILKYQKRRMIVPIIGVLFFMPFIIYGLFVDISLSTLQLIMGKLCASLLLVIMLPFLVDMLLFEEVRLYRNRIVKTWKLLGERELALAKVGLMSQSWPTWGIGAKCFFEQGMSPYWRWLTAIFHSMGITYKEHFADRKKVKQLNSLLAELSGRRVEEFEQTVTMERLIQRKEP